MTRQDKWASRNRWVKRASQAWYRAKQGNRLVGWSNRAEIAAVYALAEWYNRMQPEKGPWEVDHIIPIHNDPYACGLHVFDNLRIIPRYKNRVRTLKPPNYRHMFDGEKFVHF